MQYRFSGFVLDTATFALRYDGEPVDVEPQVMNLLRHLIENRDRVVKRDELLDAVFGRRVVSDNALTVRIRDARRAVGDSARSQDIIKTISGVGYRFVANVEAASRISFSSQSTDDAPGSPDAGAQAISDRLSGMQPSIAVLPFELLGDAKDGGTVAKGLVHDIITRIARSRTMWVIARATAFQFPSGKNDVREVGTRLGVRYVVQGAIQLHGDKIRVSVGLAESTSCQEIWASQYDRKLDDVLTVQDEIASMIVGALDTEIQSAEMQRSVLMPSTKLDAWSAYHRGLDHMYRFRTKECDVAEKFFRRAIDLEPGVPRPYAGLSFVHYERAYLNSRNDRDSALARAFECATQAITVDPTDPMGHWALSRAHFLDGNLEAAMDSITLSADLNPSYATAQYFQGWVAMQLGEHETCLERIDLARRLSPYDPLIYGMLGVSAMNLALMGQFDEAVRRTDEGLLHPDVHYQALAWAAMCYSISGRLDKARPLLERVRAVNADYSVEDFFAVYAFQRDRDIERIREAFAAADRRQ
jgi:TolB-like protein